MVKSLSMDTKLSFKDLYSFHGFKAKARLRPHPDHAGAMVVTLNRRQKKRFVNVAMFTAVGTITEPGLYVTSILAVRLCTWNLRFAGSPATDVMP